MNFLIISVLFFTVLSQTVFGNMLTLASNGDCQFYQELEQVKQCGLKGYPIAYGFKYCQKFGDNINNFNNDGKKWVDSVRKCLMGKLLNSQMNCASLENFAFGTHVDCYLNPGYGAKGICDIWASQNAVGLLTTYELQDFFKNFVALSQVFATMGQCLVHYGSSSIQFLANAVSGLGQILVG